MKRIKWFLKIIGIVCAIPLLYLLISLVLSSISVHDYKQKSAMEKEIFLSTNGVHLDISIHHSLLDKHFRENLMQFQSGEYYSFGWGDENFYLNTPTWSDLTFKNAFSAMFLKSSTLMHVTSSAFEKEHWVAVPLNQFQLSELNNYLKRSFVLGADSSFIHLTGKGYGSRDEFYKAHGSYSCLFTCNSWVNDALKTSGIKSCYWTPFDFSLLSKYK